MKAYLVKYTGGLDDYFENHVFVTHSRVVAKAYCLRANRMLKEWKKYYSQFTHENHGIVWLRDEHYDKYNRWRIVDRILAFTIEEIEVR